MTMSAPAADSWPARVFSASLGHVLRSMPQWRKTTTTSALARARCTAATSASTFLADARPGCPGRRGPRSDELGVEHLRRADDGDAPTLHRGDEGRVGVDVVVADADDEVIGLRVLHRERLGETVRPVVASVVVRHAHRVEAARTEGVDRGRWGAEGEVLVLGGTARGDGGLEIADGQVGGGQDRGEGTDGGSRIVRQPGRHRSLEVHVAGEGERDRLGRCGRRSRRRLSRPDRRAVAHGAAAGPEPEEHAANSSNTTEASVRRIGRAYFVVRQWPR